MSGQCFVECGSQKILEEHRSAGTDRTVPEAEHEAKATWRRGSIWTGAIRDGDHDGDGGRTIRHGTESNRLRRRRRRFETITGQIILRSDDPRSLTIMPVIVWPTILNRPRGVHAAETILDDRRRSGDRSPQYIIVRESGGGVDLFRDRVCRRVRTLVAPTVAR
jgi:hypothetical protein